MSQNKRIESWVDGLLARDACYRPLELLLLSGRLPRQRYEAWRQGELDSLEDALAGNPAHSLSLLKEAAQWAQALGLEAVEESALRGHSGRLLRLFRDPGAERLARTQYRRRVDHPQLNLFFDNPFAVARNRCCQALLEGDASRAESQWLQMSQADAHNPLLPDAEQLIDELLVMQAPSLDADALLARMQTEIAPRAQRLLGERTEQFMRPFWRRLYASLDGQPFDPERPQRHGSWLAAQAGDWQQVVNFVHECDVHADHPDLLELLINAQLALAQRQAAIAALIQLCWLNPERATRWLSGCRDSELTAASERFWDLEAELDMALFPAYLLIFGVVLPECPRVPTRLAAGSAPVSIFQTLHALSRQPQDMSLRKQLGSLDPQILALWLAGSRRGLA